jgi:hypothetical protein
MSQWPLLAGSGESGGSCLRKAASHLSVNVCPIKPELMHLNSTRAREGAFFQTNPMETFVNGAPVPGGWFPSTHQTPRKRIRVE